MRMREEDVIAAIRAIVEDRKHARIVLGIGDDAAAWQPSRSHRSVITTDALVDGVHFRRGVTPPFDIGWRAMASNVSDIAAMGARPVLATVALSLPPDARIDDVSELYRGMQAVALDANLAIAGGDLTRADVLSLTIAAVGEVRATRMKTRSAAKRGDVVAISGPLGAARAGVAAEADEQLLGGELRDEALRAYRRPVPRWREGAWLAASAHVHAMMDISDGLSTDLARLCEASGVGALIDEVPVARCAQALAQQIGVDAREFALAGGEEFELLVTVTGRAFTHLAMRFRAHFGRELLRVGIIRAGEGVALRRTDGETALSRTGWDHFAR